MADTEGEDLNLLFKKLADCEAQLKALEQDAHNKFDPGMGGPTP
jgi:hypothetical protein